MINQILKALVLENRRLIIPTIGAFLTKDIDNKQKKVTFSSFLKYDDGLLTKLLCERKYISEAEAKQEIADFAQQISSALDSMNHYSITDFGYFTRDNNGITDFVVENINTVVENTNTVFENPYAAFDPVTPPIEEVVIPKIEEPVIPPYVPPVVEIPVYEPPVFTPVQETQNTDFDFSNIIIPSANDPIPNVNVKSQKNSNIGYWILAIILLIIAALLLLYLFSKDFKNRVNSLLGTKQKTETVKTDTGQTATATTDTLKLQDTIAGKQEPVKQTGQQTGQQTQPIQSGSVTNGKYQVVLGSYLERSVAENFANEMRSKGYSVTIPDRLAGEWVIVIAYESNDPADAERVKNQFISQGYEDAYVRTRPGGVSKPIQSSQPASQPQQQVVASNSNASFSTTITKRGRYQVVAGCFLERSNAENFARELSGKGFNVTVPERLYGEYTLVMVCETDDKNEADKLKNQLTAAGYNDAWIRTR